MSGTSFPSPARLHWQPVGSAEPATAAGGSPNAR